MAKSHLATSGQSGLGRSAFYVLEFAIFIVSWCSDTRGEPAIAAANRTTRHLLSCGVSSCAASCTAGCGFSDGACGATCKSCSGCKAGCSACSGAGCEGGCCGGGCCGCGGGAALCGVSQDCNLTQVLVPTYQPPAECRPAAILSALRLNGLTALTACLRPELTVAAAASSQTDIVIHATGCPDHAYFQNAKTATAFCKPPAPPITNPAYSLCSKPTSVCVLQDLYSKKSGESCGSCKGCGSCAGCSSSSGCGTRKAGCCSSACKAGCCSSTSGCGCACNVGGGCCSSASRRGACKAGCCSSVSGCCSACRTGCQAGCKSKVGKHTPITRQLSLTLPARAVVSSPVFRRTLNGTGGVVGMALNGVLFVNEHVEAGVKMTFSFDDCGGHGDSKNRYHYHMPPRCLLQGLGSAIPVRGDWWLSHRPELEWPLMTTKASDGTWNAPLLGWTLDGFPLFGPYDPESGRLQLPFSADFGSCYSALDQCNGKRLSDGSYAYFVTPVWPFLPKCLIGSAIGFLKDEKMSTVQVCPQAGYAPIGHNSLRSCHTTPQFLFLEISEASNKASWIISSAVLGCVWVFLGVFVCMKVNPMQVRSHTMNQWTPEELSDTVGYKISTKNLKKILRTLGISQFSNLTAEKGLAAKVQNRFERAQRSSEYKRRSLQMLQETSDGCQQVDHIGEVLLRNRFRPGYTRRFLVLQGRELHFHESREAWESGARSLDTVNCHCMTIESETVESNSDAAAMGSFLSMDTDGDGLLSLDELRANMQAQNPNVTESQVVKRFKELDINGDGRVDANEFLRSEEKKRKSLRYRIRNFFHAVTGKWTLWHEVGTSVGLGLMLGALIGADGAGGLGAPMGIAGGAVVTAVASGMIDYGKTLVGRFRSKQVLPTTNESTLYGARAKYVFILTDIGGKRLQCKCFNASERDTWYDKIQASSGQLGEEERQEVAMAHVFRVLMGDVKSFERIYYATQIMIWTRAFFLLADPYRAYKIIPNFIIAMSYGIFFPCVNLLSIELLHILGLRGRLYSSFLLMTAGQFITQIGMDGVRSWGAQPKWHFICQLYYDVWAAIVFLTGTYLVHSSRFENHNKIIGSVDITLLLLAVTYAFLPLGGALDPKVFALTLIWRLIELMICVLYSGIYLRGTKKTTTSRIKSLPFSRLASTGSVGSVASCDSDQTQDRWANRRDVEGAAVMGEEEELEERARLMYLRPEIYRNLPEESGQPSDTRQQSTATEAQTTSRTEEARVLDRWQQIEDELIQDVEHWLKQES